MDLPYKDRAEGAEALARALGRYAGRPGLLVLGLPRGGVPIAVYVAEKLGAAVDVLIVRKLGAPGQEELAMGAIASGGARVLNREVAGYFPQEEIERAAEREQRELSRRELAYRGDRPPPQIKGRCVILVDDGLATGSTMRAAVAAVRQYEPAQVIVATPVAPPQTVRALSAEVDAVVCPATPASFQAVGQWYMDFPQTSDDQVRELLHHAWTRQPPGEPDRQEGDN